MVMSRSLRRLGRKAAFGFAVFVIVSPAILVILWMLSLAVKNEVDNMAYPPVFVPDTFSFQNFFDVIERNRLDLYFVNSIIVSGFATLVAIAVGVPAAYGIAKAQAHKLAVLTLIARITPALSYLIPLYILFQWFGLTGTIWPIAITHLVITLPIFIYVMIGFFESLPQELEEAALIDGCNLWQAFRHVALPLARPGIVVGGILSIIFSWNNFVFAAVLGGRQTRTLPVAVFNMLTFEQVAWGPLAAAALLVTLPVLVLTLLIQKEIVGGLTAGGVKGG
jgi:multiple sugar transport system permease protein